MRWELQTGDNCIADLTGGSGTIQIRCQGFLFHEHLLNGIQYTSAPVFVTEEVQHLGRVLETANVNRNMYVVCFLLNMLLGFAALVVTNLLL